MPTGRDRLHWQGLGIWSCGRCALHWQVLLLSVVLPRDAAAMFQGSGRRDLVHRVYKVKVTEDFTLLSDDADLKRNPKRADDTCPTGYSLCAPSVGGDCCPNNYACAKSSCYATTAATSTCAGSVGYYACNIADGGGCCPQGLVCATDQQCLTPAGATYSQTCPAGYFLCPSSVNYGCCQTGMGCGETACYSTSPSTTTITYTTTEDGSALAFTTTSVTTPSVPSSDSTDTDAAGALKFYPSTESKVAATSSSESGGGSGGGLSAGDVGGIIGGAVAVLLVVLGATFFIIRRLKKTERAVKSHRESASGSGTRQTTDRKSATRVSILRVQPTTSEVDAMDFDPLMTSSGVASGRGGHRQHIRQNGRPDGTRSRSGSDETASQPSGSGSFAAGIRWNTPSADSDAGDDSNTGRGYSDVPPRVRNHPGGRHGASATMESGADPSGPMQYSYRYAYQQHGRHWSDASELSTGSDDVGSQHGVGSPLRLIPVELSIDGGFVPELPGSDTETESTSIGPHGASGRASPGASRGPRRRSAASGSSIGNIVSPVSAMAAVNRPPLTHVSPWGRQRGSSITSTMDGAQNGSGARSRSDSSVLLPQTRLGSIDESATCTAAPTSRAPIVTDPMHGYFGASDTAVGQTAAGMMLSSAVPGFVPPGPASVSRDKQGSGDDGSEGRHEH